MFDALDALPFRRSRGVAGNGVSDRDRRPGGQELICSTYGRRLRLCRYPFQMNEVMAIFLWAFSNTAPYSLGLLKFPLTSPYRGSIDSIDKDPLCTASDQVNKFLVFQQVCADLRNPAPGLGRNHISQKRLVRFVLMAIVV